MNLKEAALHCEAAWSQYAEENKLIRDDEFYFFKMQEELGELTRSFLELRGSERQKRDSKEALRKKFEGDCASLIGNALILARHFGVNIENTIKEKFSIKT